MYTVDCNQFAGSLECELLVDGLLTHGNHRNSGGLMEQVKAMVGLLDIAGRTG
jgi:hypothetical protein